MKFLGLVFLLSSFTIHADDEMIQSLFGACQGITMMHEKAYNKQKKLWDESKQCGIQSQIVPETTFWEATFSRLGNKTETLAALSFLNRVANKASEFIDQNNLYSDIFIHCARNDQAWFTKQNDTTVYDYGRCETLLTSVRDTIKVIRPHLRYHLALSAYKNFTLTAESIKAQDNVNWKLKEASGTIAPHMDPLNTDELALVLKTFNEYTDIINAEWEKVSPDENEFFTPVNSTAAMIGTGVTVEDQKQTFFIFKRKKYQVQHTARYLELLSQVPILAYLGEENPTNEQLALAAEKLIENGLNEKAKIKRIMDNDKILALDPSGPVHTRAKAMMEFMKYGPVINEILEEDSKLCSEATGLAQYVSKISMRNNIALVAGMVGVSLFVGLEGGALVAGVAGLESLGAAALSTIAVLPIAGFIYLHDYLNYVRSRQQNFNAIETIEEGKSLASMDDFSRAKSTVMVNLALSATGIDLWGIGLTKYAFIVGGAVITGKSLAQQSTKIAFKKVLTKQGVSLATVDKWMANLGSDDVKVIQQTIHDITKEANFSSRELKLFQTIVTKMAKDLSEQDLKRLEFFFYRLPQDPALRAQVVESSLKVLEKLGPDALTSADRHTKLRALVAMTSFGEHDANKIVSLFSNWDKGIDGLARSYELAAEKLKTLPLSSFNSQAARQKKAFDMAVDELIKTHPDLKSLTKTEAVSLKQQMLRCGFVI